MPNKAAPWSVIATLTASLVAAPLSLSAQTAPSNLPPIKPQARVPVPVKPVPRIETAPSTIAQQGQQANASVVRNGIRIMDFDNTARGDYRLRFIVRGIGARPADEIIVERKGVCGWTTSAFDGGKAPKPPKEQHFCGRDFDAYAAAVQALTRNRPAHPDYYEITIDKYMAPYSRWKRFISQPVMVVVRGPGARVTRHKLEVLDNATAPAAAPKVDNDRDGYPPYSAGGTDCDDNNGNRFPGNLEIPNQEDEDCDPRTIGKLDRDGDGFTDWRISNPAFGNRARPVTGRDCDDRNARVHPNHPEDFTDGIDNNCDGAVDYYPD